MEEAAGSWAFIAPEQVVTCLGLPQGGLGPHQHPAVSSPLGSPDALVQGPGAPWYTPAWMGQPHRSGGKRGAVHRLN